jgi:hypothetical protein
LLKGPEPETRIQAALALWKIDGEAKETVAVLVAALKTVVAPRQNNTLNLPGRFGLISTAAPPPPGQLAAEALGQMGTAARAAVPALQEALKDPYLAACHPSYAAALKKIGG